MTPGILGDINVCALVRIDGVLRVRVFGWFHHWDRWGQRDATDHAKGLRARGFSPWIDRTSAPADTLGTKRELTDYRPREEQRTAAAPPPVALPTPRVEKTPEPLPRVVENGIHVAGAFDGVDQFCTRCGGLLATRREGVSSVPMRGYTTGVLVQRGRGWQAETLIADKPTCEPVLEGV